ncbi:protease modulator HflC [Psychromonas sp. Urea-02u-13]|uniref:protease modulator HflC n=1 Tax=Psychromonas sp. Urea-02u-13 TaxID=2058326 RepID=UPI000C32847D|nr:protease modulator HflC [Psychromonas sp. Urea-02u-13]PKG40764.1 protease modulator HflC [Psychromonas sp. Urea-02u-13]
MNKLLILPVLLFLAFISSAFVVSEGQSGIVMQFSKVKRDAEGKPVVYPAGLHFKVPMIDSVRIMDTRIQTLDDQADRFVTSEKKDLIIDSYVKWQIEDLAVYYLATGGNKMQAEALLKRKINNGLRNEIGSHTIKEIVSGKRGEVMETALKRMARSSELGIKVVDVRIKKINLPDEVSNSVYKRMRAERQAVAREHRSQGQEKSEVIRANIDRKVSIMLAQANKSSLEVRGEGDAQSSKIYADSYSQDTDFFAFLRSMKAYEKSFSGKDDVMVLSPDSEFFKFMNSKG